MLERRISHPSIQGEAKLAHGIGRTLMLNHCQEGREALQELLSPDDHTKLLAARVALPPAHDGITVQTSKGRMAWRMRKDPGKRCMLERQALCDILRHGAMDPSGIEGEKNGASIGARPVIEYGRGVKSMKEVLNRWQLVLSDGEVVYCDLLIGKLPKLLLRLTDRDRCRCRWDVLQSQTSGVLALAIFEDFRFQTPTLDDDQRAGSDSSGTKLGQRPKGDEPDLRHWLVGCPHSIDPR
jgi:hypothetical protein